MTRTQKWTLAGLLCACCAFGPSSATGQTNATEAVYRPLEQQTTLSDVAYRRGWYGRPSYYGTYYRGPYRAYRPYAGYYYSAPRDYGYYGGYYGAYYGPRIVARPYYGWGYYGFGTPYYGYTYGRPAFRYGVGWY